MSLHDQFLAAVRGGLADDSDAGALPGVLTRACVETLPIEGASLSVLTQLRLPLGFSDDTAAFVERIQVTMGEGPCLATSPERPTMTATSTMLRNQWPAFFRAIVHRTPYRSVMSLHLAPAGYRAALDLYSTDHSAAVFPDADVILSAVAEPIIGLLEGAPSTVDQLGQDVPAWLASDSVTRRSQVWVACGMVMEHHARTSEAALALLRSYAQRVDRDLDAVVQDVVDRNLDVDEVLTGAA